MQVSIFFFFRFVHLLVQKIKKMHSKKLSLLQFRPVIPTQQGQPFMPTSSASQQFLPHGQGISSPNVGMPPNQSQPLQYSQPMQQLPPRPPHPMQYMQTSMPITSSSPQPQQVAPQLNSHMSGLGGPGVPFSSSYTVSYYQCLPLFLYLGFPSDPFFIILCCLGMHRFLLLRHNIMSLRHRSSSHLKCMHSSFLLGDSRGCQLVVRVDQLLHLSSRLGNNLWTLLSQLL